MIESEESLFVEVVKFWHDTRYVGETSLHCVVERMIVVPHPTSKVINTIFLQKKKGKSLYRVLRVMG